MPPTDETVSFASSVDERLDERLHFCMRMLHIHDLLTDAERLRIMRRLARRKSERDRLQSQSGSDDQAPKAPKAPKAKRGGSRAGVRR